MEVWYGALIIMTCGFNLVLGVNHSLFQHSKKVVWPCHASVFPGKQEMLLVHLLSRRQTSQIST